VARQDIDGIVRAVAPRPVNVLAMANVPLTVADLTALGVRRISVGSALSRVAWGAFIRAARAIVDQGSFEAFDDAMSFAALNAIFGAEGKGAEL
jgi:2-methylisocitrate lyase-like PEP mutase family enzyme